MRIAPTCLSAILVLSLRSASIEPDIQWAAGFPHAGASVIWDGTELATGDYAAVGEISIGPSETVFTMAMFDPQGEIIWDRTLLSMGCSSGRRIMAFDDHFLVCGFSSDSVSILGFLMRTDLDGSTVWTATEGYGLEDRFMDMCTDSAGNIYAAGFSMNGETGDRDILAVCFSDSGSMLWRRRYQEPGMQTAESIAWLDGEQPGLVMTGSDGSDVFLMKVDPLGNWLWKTRHYLEGIQYASDLLPLQGGGYLVTGSTRIESLFSDAFLAVFDSEGMVHTDLSWGKNGPDMAHTVLELAPAGFLILLNSNAGDGTGYRPLLVRFDPWLTRLWELAVADTDALCYTARTTSDGGFIVSGKIIIPGESSVYSSYMVKIGPEDLFDRPR